MATAPAPESVNATDDGTRIVISGDALVEVLARIEAALTDTDEPNDID